jgi:hypothetical protein
MSTPTLEPALSAAVAADLARARQRTGLGCWSVFLGLGALVSLGLAAYVVVTSHNRTEIEQFGAIFGGAALLLALLCAVAVWKVRQARSALHDAVVVRRSDVVWVYPKHKSVDIKAYYGGRHVGREQYLSLIVAFADATSTEVSLASLQELTEVTGLLERWLPHAQHGYSADIERQYASDPGSLRRA